MSKPSPAEPAKTQKPIKQSVTASKKTYESLWRFIFLIVSIISGFLINKIYIYQTERSFDDVRKGQFLHILMYGIPFAIFYTISDLIVHKIFDGLCDKYFINHAKFTDQQSRKKRCYTLVKWGFSILYYGFSSLAAFLLLRKTSYFPTWLGGSGSPENIYNDFPQNSQFSGQIQVFYILQFGKHFSRTFGHFFIRPQGNFYEYGLHHILSISLILFSYTMDHWLIGTFVLLVHDFTDFTLIFARGYREYRHRSQKVLQIFYVSAFVSWIFCRIFIFSYAFIYSLNKGIFQVLLPKMETILPPIYKQTMFFPALFMSGMLITLEGLQIFWTYYILRSYIAVSVSSKIVSHNYD